MSELRRGDRIADYVIERELGRGGMGAVYLGFHERLNRRVALKVIVASLAGDPEFRARFKREARIAATLEHPYVVPVYDIGEENGTLFIAMRYIEGRDLAAELRDRGRIDPARLGRLLTQVASALDAAHRAGLVHRDVKPANVLVTGHGSDELAYLTDFGLVRDAASLSALTGTGQWIGTVDYAAPEQIDAKRIDARTDVYSLACMAFHALSGRVPFAGGMAAKLHGHLSATPPPASTITPGLPAAVDEVLARGMAKDPNDRHRSAGDLARELHAAISGSANSEPERTVATGHALTGIPIIEREPPTVHSPWQPAAPHQARPPRPAPMPAPTTVRPPSPGSGHRVLAFIAGGVLLAGIAGALALAGGDNSSPPPTSVAASKRPAAARTPAITQTVERTVTSPPSDSGSSSDAAAAHVLYEVDLAPPAGRNTPIGVLSVVDQDGQRALAVVADEMPASDHYVLWLRNSHNEPKFLGFFPPVEASGADKGQLKGLVAAPINLHDYTHVLITRERGESPSEPTLIVLEGNLRP